MVDRARVDAQNHWFVYNEPMSVQSVTQAVSNLAMKFGEDNDDDNEKAMVIGGHVLHDHLMIFTQWREHCLPAL